MRHAVATPAKAICPASRTPTWRGATLQERFLTLWLTSRRMRQVPCGLAIRSRRLRENAQFAAKITVIQVRSAEDAPLRRITRGGAERSLIMAGSPVTRIVTVARI